jgi:hypothetical protein
MSDQADIYATLRGMVLDLDPAQVGILPSGDPSAVWGVVMDIGWPTAVASLAGLVDGTTSLYFSNGGGMIGGGEHELVASATRDWLSVAERVVTQMTPAEEFPLPDLGIVSFAVLTFGGRYRGVAAEQALGEGSHPLSPLFFAGHLVITEFRLVSEPGG